MPSAQEFDPAIAGCRLQGTANSPSSTAILISILLTNCNCFSIHLQEVKERPVLTVALFFQVFNRDKSYRG